ncbi:MAG TPA: LPXTG cell wall anchor domain-containing protein [Actinomycetota bacterium]|nr:LPXTG cell wall anchor domain-containing protein [Actinomycetota bacterium]
MALTAVMAVTILAGGASAQEEDPYSEETPTVQPTLIIGGETETTEPGSLPLTGADLTLFAATGLAAVGTGTLIVRRARRSDDEA